MGNRLYSSSRWQRTRLQILERDAYRCRVGGPTCTHAATAVDHIIQPDKGGSMFDPANLRACCRNCNNWRARRTQLAKAKERGKAISAGSVREW